MIYKTILKRFFHSTNFSSLWHLQWTEEALTLAGAGFLFTPPPLPWSSLPESELPSLPESAFWGTAAASSSSSSSSLPPPPPPPPPPPSLLLLPPSLSEELAGCTQTTKRLTQTSHLRSAQFGEAVRMHSSGWYVTTYCGDNAVTVCIDVTACLCLLSGTKHKEIVDLKTNQTKKQQQRRSQFVVPKSRGDIKWLLYAENLLQAGHCRRHVDCSESPINLHWIPSFC